MKKFNNKITHDRLLHVISYDPDTGLFTWKNPSGRRVKAGEVVQRGSGDYNQIMIDTHSYYAHRLAWFYINKEWPDGIVDHVNRNKADNRIENLRLATHSENHHNMAHPPERNKHGMVGVTKAPYGKYSAKIRWKGDRLWLGTFDTPEDAGAAYMNKKRELGLYVPDPNEGEIQCG